MRIIFATVYCKDENSIFESQSNSSHTKKKFLNSVNLFRRCEIVKRISYLDFLYTSPCKRIFEGNQLTQVKEETSFSVRSNPESFFSTKFQQFRDLQFFMLTCYLLKTAFFQPLKITRCGSIIIALRMILKAIDISHFLETEKDKKILLYIYTSKNLSNLILSGTMHRMVMILSYFLWLR